MEFSFWRVLSLLIIGNQLLGMQGIETTSDMKPFLGKIVVYETPEHSLFGIDDKGAGIQGAIVDDYFDFWTKIPTAMGLQSATIEVLDFPEDESDKAFAFMTKLIKKGGVHSSTNITNWRLRGYRNGGVGYPEEYEPKVKQPSLFMRKATSAEIQRMIELIDNDQAELDYTRKQEALQKLRRKLQTQ